jgi:hypothetical protein
MVGRVRICDENPSDLAPIGRGAGGNAGQLLGGRRACRHAEYRRGCARCCLDTRRLTVDDGNDDGQRNVSHPVNVLVIGHGDPQVPQPFGRCPIAYRAQRGRDVRILLRPDDECGGNTQ